MISCLFNLFAPRTAAFFTHADYKLIVTPCPDTPAVDLDTLDMEFLSHLSFPIWAPTTIKTNASLSRLTLTLSRYSLSSLPQEPSLSPNSRTQKSPSQINPKTKEAQISVGVIFSRYSTMGWLRF